MAPVKRRGCCEKGHTWHRSMHEDEDNNHEEDGREDGRSSRLLVFHVIVKAIASVVAFLLMLCGCVVGKASLLLMLANMIPNLPLHPTTNFSLDTLANNNAEPPAIVSAKTSAGWYWIVLFVLVIPEIFIFAQAFRKVLTHRLPKPQLAYSLAVVSMEVLHATGLAMLMFLILPRLDSLVASTLFAALIFVPSILKTLFWTAKAPPTPTPLGEREPETGCLAQFKAKARKLEPTACLDVLVVLLQLAGFVYLPVMLLPYVQTTDVSDSTIVFYTVSMACILTSCIWWENFVSKQSALKLFQALYVLRKRNHTSRAKIQLALFPLKLLLLSLFMVLFYWVNRFTQSPEKPLSDVMADLGQGLVQLFQTTENTAKTTPNIDNVGLTEDNTLIPYSISVASVGVQAHDYWVLLILQLVSSLVVIKVGVIACQTLMQRAAFSLPLVLSFPVLLLIVGVLTHVPDGPASLHYYYKADTAYPSFKTMEHFDHWSDPLTRSYLFVATVWWVCWLWIARHIWTNKNKVRLAMPDAIFALPVYNGGLTEQHLICSRRCSDKIREVTVCSSLPACLERLESTRQTHPAMVYACVTMWHESKNEMRKLIGSLVGLDEKQAKEMVQTNPGGGFADDCISDGYGLECHVFFDDAFDAEAKEATENARVELTKLYSRATTRLLENDCTCPELSTDTVVEEKEPPVGPRHKSNILAHLVENTIKVMVETANQPDRLQPTCPSHGRSRTKVEFINSYVKQFWSLLLRTQNDGIEANEYAYLDSPFVDVQEVVVPYGACYIWKFKNGTPLYLHLKDTKKVKRRKRWSQVMYLHYIETVLLQYENSCHNGLSEKCQKIRDNWERERRAANTFVLALDGDMEFKPSSVQLLLDFMKRDSALGAVCGRVHPTGGGPVVWYQQFEYATSQWLQKTTEQVLGSVLCSPGCFSLYRADALVHHKVIGKYSRKPEEAMECLKYDQGEDRWLCTLMLKAGYRIRYCALAFAKTNAPVGFDELFNQRRRWISSSTANLIEILQDSRKLIKRNEHISYLYIMYQMVQLVSTVLSPGMTILMLDQSLSIAFCIGNMYALTLAVAPILIFTAVCLKAPEKVQLLVAQVLSIAYAILMVAELVGLFLQFTSTERFTSPTAALVILILAIFLATALLHPRSFPAYFHGSLYFFWLPAMYILLPIYSLCSLDNLSWGTREDRTVKSKERDHLPTESAGDQQQPGWTCSLGSGLRCVCCQPQSETVSNTSSNSSSRGNTSENLRMMLHQNGQILTELKSLRNIPSPLTRSTKSSTKERSGSPDSLNRGAQRVLLGDSFSLNRPTYSSMLQEQEYNRVDETLQQATLHRLPPQIDSLWTDLLRGRLRPDTPHTPSRSAVRLKAKLRELRDRAVLMFFAINGLVVALVYLLQNNSELYITLPWPWGGSGASLTGSIDSRNKFALDLDESLLDSLPAPTVAPPATVAAGPNNASCISRRSFLKYDPLNKSVQVEPVGVLFISVYVFILVIQFLCMLIHRIITFSHLLASTDYSMALNDRRRRRQKKQAEFKKRKSKAAIGEPPNDHCDCHRFTRDDAGTIDEGKTDGTINGTEDRNWPPSVNELMEEEAEIQVKKPSAVMYKSSNSLPVGMGNGYSPLRMFQDEPTVQFEDHDGMVGSLPDRMRDKRQSVSPAFSDAETVVPMPEERPRKHLSRQEQVVMLKSQPFASV